MAPQQPSQSDGRDHRAAVLAELLRSERDKLARQARFHSRRPENAEDALGDACVQFLRFYNGPPGEDALRWMLVVVKRCAWRITRRTDARAVRHGMTDIAPLGDPEPHEQVERSEATARSIELIERLKPDERTALILVGLGCSHAEIGELRGWSLTKVRRCVYEGRAHLREALARGGN